MAATNPTPADEPQAAPVKKSTLVVRIGVVLFLVVVVLGEVLVAYKFLADSGGNTASAATSEEESTAKSGDEHGAGEKKPKEHGAKEASGHGKKASHGDKAHESKSGEHGSKKSESGEHGKKAAKKESGGLPEDEAASDAEQCEVELGKFTVTAHQTASNTTMRIDFRLYGIVAGEYKDDLEKALKANQNRFREQVLVIVRSAEPTDLAEAGLGLIKRQILEKTNSLLGKPLVRSVIITDFSHIEQ